MRPAFIFFCFFLSMSPLAWGQLRMPEPSGIGSQTVRLVWFGRSGGISNHYGRDTAHLTFEWLIGQGISSMRPVAEGPAVFARGGRLLFQPGGLSVQSFREFMGRPPFQRRVLAERWPVATGPFETVFEYPPSEQTPILDLVLPGGVVPAPGLRRAEGRLVEFENREGTVVSALELPHVDGERTLYPDPSGWEVRFSFEAEMKPSGGIPRRVINVGNPQGDGARRVAAIRALTGPEEPPALILAGGGDLEGYSFVDTGQPDRQRIHSWAAYKRMGLAALVAGPLEAAFGLEALGREAEAHGVPVVISNLGGDPLPPGISPWRIVEVDGVRVLVVGVVDPDLDPRVARRRYGARPLLPPAEGAKAALAAARIALSDRPEVVVVIGSLGPEQRAKLRAAAVGADLMLADFSDRGEIPERSRSELTTPRQRMFLARNPQPLAVVQPGMLRLGVADLTLAPVEDQGARIVRIEGEALPLTGDLRPDGEVLRAVQRTRQGAYALAQRPLLPDLGPALEGGRVTAEIWRRLSVEMVREAMEAEAAIIPPLPYPWQLRGPVSQLQAAANLNTPDEVVMAWLPGVNLRALLAHEAFSSLVSAGLGTSEDGPTIQGKLITADTRTRYAVALTDSILDDPRLKLVFEGVTVTRQWVRTAPGRYAPEGWRSEGLPRPLRAVILDQLDQPRSPETLVASAQPGGLPLGGWWVVDFQDLRFEMSDYSTAGSQTPYDNVRETRVTTQSNVALATGGAFAVSRVSTALNWVNRLSFQYARNTFDDGTEEERADALRLDTELQVPAWTFVELSRAVPFISVGYESEFTPTEGNPLKRRYEGASGLLWSGTGLLKQARVAALAATDLGEAEPSTELGVLGAATLEQPLYGARGFVDGSVRYYPPGIDGVDTDSELGLWVKVRAGVDFPVTLVPGLMLETFVDVFGYRGKTEATSTPGASVLTGLAIKLSRQWKPGLEPLR